MFQELEDRHFVDIATRVIFMDTVCVPPPLQLPPTPLACLCTRWMLASSPTCNSAQHALGSRAACSTRRSTMWCWCASSRKRCPVAASFAGVSRGSWSQRWYVGHMRRALWWAHSCHLLRGHQLCLSAVPLGGGLGADGVPDAGVVPDRVLSGRGVCQNRRGLPRCVLAPWLLPVTRQVPVRACAVSRAGRSLTRLLLNPARCSYFKSFTNVLALLSYVCILVSAM